MKKLLLLIVVMFSGILGITYAGSTSSSGGGGGGGGGSSSSSSAGGGGGGSYIGGGVGGGTTIKYYSGTGKIIIPVGETKVVSFAQDLSEINFSKSSDFTIMTLEGGEWKSLDNKLENYKPLVGYRIYNAKGDDLVITYKYKANISGADKLLQRKLYPGWNLIGISQLGVNKSYYKSSALGNLQFGQVIDFSNSNFTNTKNGSYNPNFTVRSYSNSFYMWEGLGYGIFLSYNSYLPGVQDETTFTGAVKTIETTYTHTNPNPPHNGGKTYTCSKFINNYDIRVQVIDTGAKYYYPNSQQKELRKVKYILSGDRTNGFSGLVLNKVAFKLDNYEEFNRV